jgi:DNA-binding response OmpR family regulator
MVKLGKKILVTEDEEGMAQALSFALTEAGYSVSVVHDGVVALNKIKKENFDLMLLDLIMPRGDGFAVLKKLSKQKSVLPIIVLTNLSQEDDIHKAEMLGAKKVLVKSSVELQQIVQEVKKLIG